MATDSERDGPYLTGPIDFIKPQEIELQALRWAGNPRYSEVYVMCWERVEAGGQWKQVSREPVSEFLKWGEL